MRPAAASIRSADIDPNRYVAGGLAVAPDGSRSLQRSRSRGRIRRSRPGRGSSASRREAPERRAPTSRRSCPGAPAATDLCVGHLRRKRRGRGRRRRTPCRRRRPAARSGPGSTSSRRSRRTARSTRSAARISNDRYSYLVAVHPDLTPAWTASFRGILTTAAACCSQTTTRTCGCRAGAQPRRRSGDQRPPRRPRRRRGHVLAGRAAGRRDPDRRRRRPTTSAAATSSSSSAHGRGARDLRLRVGHHAGGLRARRDVLDRDQGQPLLESRTATPTTTSRLSTRISSPEWSFRRDQHGELRAPAGRRDRRASTTIPDGFEWCVNQPAIDAARDRLPQRRGRRPLRVRPRRKRAATRSSSTPPSAPPTRRSRSARTA